MIEFRHVDKVYPNGVKGLQDINLTIDQGEFVAIIGLSGAGKSLSGCIPDNHAGGQMLILRGQAADHGTDQ